MEALVRVAFSVTSAELGLQPLQTGSAAGAIATAGPGKGSSESDGTGYKPAPMANSSVGIAVDAKMGNLSLEETKDPVVASKRGSVYPTDILNIDLDRLMTGKDNSINLSPQQVADKISVVVNKLRSSLISQKKAAERLAAAAAAAKGEK